MDKPLAYGQKTHDSFYKPTYSSPAEAFLASTMANAGVPWPRKPLSGKPQGTKGKSGKSGRGKGHSTKLRKSYRIA